MHEQIHVGTHAKKQVGKLWHSDDGGKTFWSGSWYNRTPKQLKTEAESILRDLKKTNPRLFR